MQVGGDSPNTMPVAIQAGMAGHQIAKATIEPGTKFSLDAFKKSLSDPKALASRLQQGTVSNLALSDALQQQSFITRWAQKIPGVGPRITSWLGPDAALNNLIGGMGKEAAGGVSKATITKIALEGGDDVAKKLIAAGVPKEAAKSIAEAAGKRVATSVATSAVQAVATSAVDDVAKQALALTLKKGAQGVTEEAVKAALANPATARETLMKMGFYAKDATALVKSAATASAKGATTAATTAAATTAAEQTAKGGIKGFFGKILGGAKGNFVIAGVFSAVTNVMQVAQGKMTIPQFFALTATDTLAYGAIGWGSAAAAGAIAQALIPIPGAGFLIGLGLGLLGGMVYEKFIRNPLKNALGGDPSAAGQLPDSATPPLNPYGTQAPSTAPAYVPPTPGVDLSYEQALAEIDRMAAGRR